MLHELWDDPADADRFTFCVSGPLGHEVRAAMSPEARLVWTVEAATYFEAMTRYYQHQGWGHYDSNHELERQTYESMGWEVDGLPVYTNWVESMTARLRGNDDSPSIVRLRQLLTEYGINTRTAVVAAFQAEGSHAEFAVVLSDDGKVHTFDIETTTPRIGHAEDITDTWDESPYRRDVKVARIAFPPGRPPGAVAPQGTNRRSERQLHAVSRRRTVTFAWDIASVIPFLNLPQEPEWFRDVLELSSQLVDDLRDWSAEMNALWNTPDRRTREVYQALDLRARELVTRVRKELGPTYIVRYMPWEPRE